MKNQLIYRFTSYKSSKNYQKINKTIEESYNLNKLGNINNLEFKTNTICRYYDTKKSHYNFCIILNNSFKTCDEVLICPLSLKENNYLNLDSVSVGILPYINLNLDFQADIKKIHFINKKYINYEDFINSKEPFGKILDIYYDKIIKSYLNLINYINSKTYNNLETIIIS